MQSPQRRPTRRLVAEELASLRRALANRRETGWSTVEEASKNSELYRTMRDYLPALLDMAEEDLRLREVACQCEYGASAHCPVHGVLPELVASASL